MQTIEKISFKQFAAPWRITPERNRFEMLKPKLIFELILEFIEKFSDMCYSANMQPM